MSYQHTLPVRAPLADVARFRAGASSPRAVTPLFPLQLYHAPQDMGGGDETDLTMAMWLDLPLWIGFEVRKARKLLRGVGA